MNVMEPVEPVFAMQAAEKLSMSVQNISRMKYKNTNLINGFYSVRDNEVKCIMSFAPGAKEFGWWVSLSSQYVSLYSVDFYEIINSRRKKKSQEALNLVDAINKKYDDTESINIGDPLFDK